MSKYGQNEHLLPLLAPIDIVAVATDTAYLDLNHAAGTVEIALDFGVITSTDSTGEVVVTLTCNPVGDTSSSDSVETALAFQYKLSAAVATDSMGALTAATTAGVAVLNTSDNKVLSIFFEPSDVAQAYAGARFVRATITPTAETTVCIVGASARFVPRYAGESQLSST